MWTPSGVTSPSLDTGELKEVQNFLDRLTKEKLQSIGEHGEIQRHHRGVILRIYNP